ncbi:MAG: type II toxin-antitoxin system RelE/ParE family toxin [Ignavibacteriales bacterium]|nr:type II toxin-antitoxin system RelE/ParE family toxin [Ignavibacteriales bacterium]
MVEIIWSHDALESLREIGKFIERDSHFYAARTIIRLIESVERLLQFPLSGRIIPELHNKNFREVIVGNYRIMYHLRKNKVIIFTVLHSSRDAEKFFADI